MQNIQPEWLGYLLTLRTKRCMLILDYLNKIDATQFELTLQTVRFHQVRYILVIMEDNMNDFSLSSARRVARQIVDMRDDKRKALLRAFPTDLKCKIVEEMVSIRLERLRGSDGMIRPGKVSNR
tara:strand:- start:2192 stop:2563 length:372 start_codon:yes stop_codon:yes gene_type:complete